MANKLGVGIEAEVNNSVVTEDEVAGFLALLARPLRLKGVSSLFSPVIIKGKDGKSSSIIIAFKGSDDSTHHKIDLTGLQFVDENALATAIEALSEGGLKEVKKEIASLSDFLLRVKVFKD